MRKNFFGKIAALMLCVVMLGVIAPFQVQASDNIRISVLPLNIDNPDDPRQILGPEFTLLHRGVAVESATAIRGGAVFFEPFTLADIDNLEVKVTNLDGWYSEFTIVPLSKFNLTEGRFLGFNWPVSSSPVTPPVVAPPEPQPPGPPPVVQPPAGNHANRTIHVVFGNDFHVQVNGNRLATTPFVNEDNRTMVPLRAIIEPLDANVTWLADTNQIRIVPPIGTPIYLTVGSTVVQGSVATLDTAPVNIDGTVFVPLRFLGELTGATVTYTPA